MFSCFVAFSMEGFNFQCGVIECLICHESSSLSVAILQLARESPWILYLRVFLLVCTCKGLMHKRYVGEAFSNPPLWVICGWPEWFLLPWGWFLECCWLIWCCPLWSLAWCPWLDPLHLCHHFPLFLSQYQYSLLHPGDTSLSALVVVGIALSASVSIFGFLVLYISVPFTWATLPGFALWWSAYIRIRGIFILLWTTRNTISFFRLEHFEELHCCFKHFETFRLHALESLWDL